MAVNRYDSTRAWYAISTYSGYEDKVADSINQRTNTVEMANKIFEAIVPKEKQIEIKNGKRKIVDRKILQGYVLVDMKLSDETWYIIRNTPGVTGFIGTGTQPTPVSEKEITKIKKRMGVEDPKFSVKYEVGEVALKVVPLPVGRERHVPVDRDLAHVSKGSLWTYHTQTMSHTQIYLLLSKGIVDIHECGVGIEITHAVVSVLSVELEVVAAHKSLGEVTLHKGIPIPLSL